MGLLNHELEKNAVVFSCMDSGSMVMPAGVSSASRENGGAFSCIMFAISLPSRPLERSRSILRMFCFEVARISCLCLPWLRDLTTPSSVRAMFSSWWIDITVSAWSHRSGPPSRCVLYVSWSESNRSLTFAVHVVVMFIMPL